MFGCWDDSSGGFGSVPALLGPPRRVKAPFGFGRRDLRTHLSDLGYDPRAGGMAVVNGVCYQNGYVTSCEDETPLFIPPSYQAPTNNTGVDPRQYLPPSGGPGPAPTPAVMPKPPRQIKPQPPVHVPPRIEPPPSPPYTSPVHRVWSWRRRRPPVRRPYVEKSKPTPIVTVAPVELCPIRGYVSRDIPGANEYQNFRCTPGQPVVIDTGLQAVGRQEALARHGLSGLSDLSVGGVDIPQWALIAGAVGLAFMFLGKRR